MKTLHALMLCGVAASWLNTPAEAKSPLASETDVHDVSDVRQVSVPPPHRSAAIPAGTDAAQQRQLPNQGGLRLCPLLALSPTSGPAKTYIQNACVRITGNPGYQLTGTGANRVVYFNNLVGGQTYTMTVYNNGVIAQTYTNTFPAGLPAAACFFVRYNTTGGRNWQPTWISGLSAGTASICDPP